MITRSHTRLQNAGLKARDKTPAWAEQSPHNFGPLPSATDDLDEVEVIPFPASIQTKTTLIIHGTTIPRQIVAFRKMGLKGKQFVLTEGRARVARHRLCCGNDYKNQSLDGLQQVAARKKKSAAEKSQEEGNTEKLAIGVYAVAFKDEKNEGPAAMIYSPRTQLIIGVIWADRTRSWEFPSTISSFLKKQTAGYLYDIAVRSEQKYLDYVNGLQFKSKNGEGKNGDGQDGDSMGDDESTRDDEIMGDGESTGDGDQGADDQIRKMEKELIDLKEQIETSKSERETLRGNAMGQVTKLVKRKNKLYLQFQKDYQQLCTMTKSQPQPELLTPILPEGWPNAKVG